MKKRLGVLLLRLAGGDDNPSKDYADRLFTNAGRGTRNLVDYYDEMSHGRLDIGDSQVFNWIDYGHTNQDLNDVWNKTKADQKKILLDSGVAEADTESKSLVYANSVKRDKIVEWAREAAGNNQINLTPFDVIVCVFNVPVDYFGSVGRTVLNWDPSSKTSFTIDLTGVAHEVGHGLGLNHSRLKNSDKEYGDPWDIMSAYDGIFYDTSGADDPPGSPYLTFGPGLNAVNMDLAGWLDYTRLLTVNASAHFHLRPLHRRDLEGWLAAKIRLKYETVYVEFRIKEGWDNQIPASCILIHRQGTHPGDGMPCSELIPVADKGDIGVGDSFDVGDAGNPFGFYAKITLVDIDEVNKEAYIGVYIREERAVEIPAIPFAGVTTDGGGWIFTLGRGWKKIPPHSPLLQVYEMLSEIEALQELSRGEQGVIVDQLVDYRLNAAMDHLSNMVQNRQQYHVPAPENRNNSVNTSTNDQ